MAHLVKLKSGPREVIVNTDLITWLEQVAPERTIIHFDKDNSVTVDTSLYAVVGHMQDAKSIPAK